MGAGGPAPSNTRLNDLPSNGVATDPTTVCFFVFITHLNTDNNNNTVFIQRFFQKPYCPKALYMLYKNLAKINDIVQCQT